VPTWNLLTARQSLQAAAWVPAVLPASVSDEAIV
jgi:hypothetical protein